MSFIQAFPHIWVPRRPRILTPGAMMLHLQRSSTTGHLIKTSSGHLAKQCATGITCANCNAGTVPTTLRNVLSGLTLSGACLTAVGGGAFCPVAKLTGTLPSGTYDVPVGGSCGPIQLFTWTSMTLSYYTSGCASICSSATSSTFSIAEYLSGSGYVETRVFVNFPLESVEIFHGQIVGPVNCNTTIGTMSNILPAGSACTTGTNVLTGIP